MVGPQLNPQPGGSGFSLRVFLPLATGFLLFGGTRILPLWTASDLLAEHMNGGAFPALNKECIVASVLLTATLYQPSTPSLLSGIVMKSLRSWRQRRPFSCRQHVFSANLISHRISKIWRNNKYQRFQAVLKLKYLNLKISTCTPKPSLTSLGVRGGELSTPPTH